MTNALIEFKLLDELLLSRNELISTYLRSVALQRESIKIANKIERLIPSLNASHIDSFDIVFIKLSNRLGEHNRHRQLPDMSNLIQMSEKKLEETVTHVIDGTLWDVLFNRLGFYGWLSEKQKNEFFKICKENPKAFDCATVTGTLENFYVSATANLTHALFDSIQSLDISFVNNSKKQFKNKFIVKNGFHEYGNGFRLDSHSPLITIMNVIGKWLYSSEFMTGEKGISPSELLELLTEKVNEAGDDLSMLDNFDVFGINFKFYKNKSIHVSMPRVMISRLNNSLSETKALFCE